MEQTDVERPLGVVLAFRRQGKYLLLKELVAKPQNGKKAGMLGFLCETYKPIDGCLKGTAVRGQDEELGQVIVPANKIEFIGELEFPHVIVQVALIDVNETFRATPTVNDVAHHGWVTLAEMKSLYLRPEMGRVLELLNETEKVFVD